MTSVEDYPEIKLQISLSPLFLFNKIRTFQLERKLEEYLTSEEDLEEEAVKLIQKKIKELKTPSTNMCSMGNDFPTENRDQTNKELEDEIKLLRKKISDQEKSQNKLLRDLTAENENLKKQIKEQKSSDFEIRYQTLLRENEELKDSLERESIKRKREIEKQSEAASQEKEGFKKQFEIIKNQLKKQNRNLEEDNQNLKDEIERINQECEKLKATASRVEEEKSQIESRYKLLQNKSMDTMSYQTQDISYYGDLDDESNIVKPKKFVDNIILAAQYGSLESVKYLIKTNPNIVNYRSNKGYYAIHQAALFNQIPIALYLIKHDAKVDAIVKSSHETPLILAARNGFFELCKIFIDNGADINYKDAKDKTAYDYACEGDNEQLIEMLTPKMATKPARLKKTTTKTTTTNETDTTSFLSSFYF